MNFFMPDPNDLPELSAMLPDSIDTCHKITDDRNFNRQNLYGYIDGGAELYLSYGFIQGLHREYESKNGIKIIVDIFDMASAKNAFGVFSHSRESEETDFGQGSQFFEDALIFWKDRYYISVSTLGQDNAITEKISKLGRYIEKSITTIGEPPPLIGLLPVQGLQPESVIYFNHYVWQNSHCFIHDENILNIDSLCDALLAKYRTGKESLCLLLIKFISVQDSKKAFLNFSSTFGMNDLQSVRTAEKKWILVDREKEYIVIVMNAADKTAAEQLMESIIKKI
jgi:hypothetical protein